MFTIFNALLPVFALVLIGYLLRRSAFLGDTFWQDAARLTYFFLLPALLVNRIATASLASASLGRLVGALVGAILIIALMVLLSKGVLVQHLQFSNAAFTSVFQGAVRQNTYVGLAVSTAFFGAEGTTYAAIGIGAMVPLVNLLSVGVLTRYTDDATLWTNWSKKNWAETLLAVAKNPLILACLLGGFLNLFGVGLPWGSTQVTAILGRAALPLGLLTVGAGLEPRSMGRLRTRILLASILKLLVLPCVFLALAWLLDLNGSVLMVGLILAALPTSSSAYILAQQMGGDHQLMAAILTAQTALACVTMLFLLTIVQSFITL